LNFRIKDHWEERVPTTSSLLPIGPAVEPRQDALRSATCEEFIDIGLALSDTDHVGVGTCCGNCRYRLETGQPLAAFLLFDGTLAALLLFAEPCRVPRPALGREKPQGGPVSIDGQGTVEQQTVCTGRCVANRTESCRGKVSTVVETGGILKRI